MQRTLIDCDKCEKKDIDVHFKIKTVDLGKWTKEDINGRAVPDGTYYDFCEECYELFIKFLPKEETHNEE